MNNGNKFFEGEIKTLQGITHKTSKGVECPKCHTFYPKAIRLFKCNVCEGQQKKIIITKTTDSRLNKVETVNGVA